MSTQTTDDPMLHQSHRPWPVPAEAWVMAQRWSQLLFAHWPVPLETVRRLVPPQISLDTYDDTAWLSITSFSLSGLRVRGLPAFPVVSEFPELNVRTYVTMDGKPGVWFFSLDAGSSLAVVGAKAAFKLPYFRAAMSVKEDGGWVEYRSARDGGGKRTGFHARYRPLDETGPGEEPHPLDRWLTERYCLYTVDGAGSVLRVEIHHPQWPLRRAEAVLLENSMSPSPEIKLDSPPARVSFSRSIDVVVWRPHLL